MNAIQKLSLLILSVLLTSWQAHATTEQPEEPIVIEEATYNGSGCPLGSADELINDNSLRLDLWEFVAQAGPNLGLSDGRRNCQITLIISSPVGWQHSAPIFDLNGYAFFNNEITANLQASYYFQGQPQTSVVTQRITGPFNDEVYLQVGGDLEYGVWSPCGTQRALNINFSIFVRNGDKVNSPDAAGLFVMDAITLPDLAASLQWRRCQTDIKS